MDITKLKKDASDVVEMLKTLKVEDIGFFFDINKEETFISCTCGYKNKLSSRYDTKKKEAFCVYNRDNGGYFYTCPNCGQHLFYELDYPFDDNTCCLGFKNKELLNTEEILAIIVNPIGIIANAFEEAIFEGEFAGENDFVVIFLNKEKKEFKILNGYLPYDIENSDNENIIEVLENMEKIEISKIFNYSDFEYSLECTFNNVQFLASGLPELYSLVNKYVELQYPLSNNDSLMSILNKFYFNNKLNYLDDLLLLQKEKNIQDIYWLQLNISNYNKSLYWYNKFIEDGINVNGKTVKEAFGIELEEINLFDSYNTFIKQKDIINFIKENDMQAYIFENFDKKDFFETAGTIVSTFKKIEKTVNFEDFIKFIKRSMQNQKNCSIYGVLYDINKIIDSEDEEAKGIINFKKEYSILLEKEFDFITSKKLTKEQCETFYKKPTLDTFCKIVKNNEIKKEPI